VIANLKPYLATKDSGVPWLGTVPEHREVKRGRALVGGIDILALEKETKGLLDEIVGSGRR
jgi:hypothetical protein